MRWENYFAKCRLSDDGILHCTEEADVTTKFSAAAQNGLFEIEDTSWWFQYRSQVICRIAHKFLNEEHIIFDVGGGATVIQLIEWHWMDIVWLCWSRLPRPAGTRRGGACGR